MPEPLLGHIQELAIVEVVEQVSDASGVTHPTESAVVNSLRLAPSFGGVWYENLDWGFPSIDAVMSPFSNQSGSFDETRYHRDRAISVDLVVVDDWFPDRGAELWPAQWNNSSYWLRQLGRWTNPAGRYRLYWRETGLGAGAYWTDIRAAGMTAPIQMQDRDLRRVQMNFICASGKIYEFNEAGSGQATKDGHTRNVFSFGGVSSPGINIPLTFPLDFPGGAVQDTTGITYNGNVPAGFVARIWAGGAGDTVDPRMDITGPDGVVTTVRFSGLTIPSGQYVQIDTNRMTVLMNGIPGERRENALIAPLQYPQLQPGLNRVNFTATSADNDSYIETLHYDAYLA